MESNFGEEALFSNDIVKEEIFDPEYGQFQLTIGNGEMLFIKEEPIDTLVVKEEAEDEEMWRYGGFTTGEEPRFDEYSRSDQNNEESEGEAEGELIESPKRIKIGRVARPKKFYGDFIDFDEECKGSGMDRPKEEKREISMGVEACPVDGCSARLSSSEEMAKHMKTHRSSLLCGICKRPFPGCWKFRRHYRTHTGEKPFQCDNCKKTFAREDNLHTHQRIHTGEQPYACDMCAFKTSDSSAIRRHKRIHTEEKPHSCTICKKTFSRSFDLTVHNRTHAREFPYECVICGFKASQLSHLKRHQRIHTGEKPYCCTTCGFKTARSDGLTAHKKRLSH